MILEPFDDVVVISDDSEFGDGDCVSDCTSDTDIDDEVNFEKAEDWMCRTRSGVRWEPRTRLEDDDVIYSSTCAEERTAVGETSIAVASRNGTTQPGSTSNGSSGTDEGSHPGTTPQDAIGNQVKPKPIGISEMYSGKNHRDCECNQDHGDHGGCVSFLGQGKIGHISATSEPLWHEIELTIDSGACDTVMPINMCGDIRVDPSDPTIHCAVFEVANGASILNIGEKRCMMMTE